MARVATICDSEVIMKKDTDTKTPTFPRRQVIERQAERTRKALQLNTETLDLVRGGRAMYGGPDPDSRWWCES
jgi:hypothetical protein